MLLIDLARLDKMCCPQHGIATQENPKIAKSLALLDRTNVQTRQDPHNRRDCAISRLEIFLQSCSDEQEDGR